MVPGLLLAVFYSEWIYMLEKTANSRPGTIRPGSRAASDRNSETRI